MERMEMKNQTEELDVGKSSKNCGGAGQGKKPYRSPRLAVYGDLRRITRGTKGGLRGDGGDGPTTNSRLQA